MTLQEEIKELRTRLNQLEKQVSHKRVIKKYVPKRLQKYFYVNDNGDIIRALYLQVNIDDYRISIGNCFKTKEEAEKHKRILINTQKLKDIAERLNNGVGIDWESTKQAKYWIKLEESIYSQCSYTCSRNQGTIYCLNENFLDRAIEEIGKEELIELIKGE